MSISNKQINSVLKLAEGLLSDTKESVKENNIEDVKRRLSGLGCMLITLRILTEDEGGPLHG